MPELTKLERTKSMIRYLPPNGTAGLARSLVKRKSRSPLPPASTTPKTYIDRLVFRLRPAAVDKSCYTRERNDSTKNPCSSLCAATQSRISYREIAPKHDQSFSKAPAPRRR